MTYPEAPVRRVRHPTVGESISDSRVARDARFLLDALLLRAGRMSCGFELRTAVEACSQILLHAAYARRIPFSQRFTGCDCLDVCLVMNKWASSGVKSLPISRNHDHHIGGYPGSRLCVLRTQLRMAKTGGPTQLEAASNQDCCCGSDHPSEKPAPRTRHIVF